MSEETIESQLSRRVPVPLWLYLYGCFSVGAYTTYLIINIAKAIWSGVIS